ncbi:cytochrome c biogenesis CcdA family protein [Schaalia sp. lx-260]|uniref:cytochrome c biogenesis CcdA family protein n=1 Tax=Schaalia sp. lx-260 TaxID=2899082 RepID=UPI001E311514|nr:cytochrome c biogenesis protein CcdA [Schaalia sp. lx-260]MCD4549809.1 cytochrome c biogenesis protein CcdA [Schaalia sp. lx-260]
MMTLPAWAAFCGGILTLFAPCSVMVLPAFFAYAFTSRTTLLLRTAIFWAGLLTALLPLAVLSGSVGSAFHAHSHQIVVAAAGLIIVLAFLQIFSVEFHSPVRFFRSLWMKYRRGLPRFSTSGAHSSSASPASVQLDEGSISARTGKLFTPTSAVFTSRSHRLRSTDDSANPLAVYLLGITYGVAGVGCAGPILGAVLLGAGLGGSLLSALWLMFLYGSGMCLPLLLLAIVWRSCEKWMRPLLRPRPVKLLGRWTTWTHIISGLFFLFLGVSLIWGGLWLPFQHFFSSSALADLESRTIEVFSLIPWWLPVGIVAILAVGIYALRRYLRVGK